MLCLREGNHFIGTIFAMRKIIIQLTALMIAFSSNVFANGPAVPTLAPKVPNVAAKAYLLIDANSGAVLAEKNSDLKVEPASLTKMMTMFIIDNEIKAGKIKLTDEVLISKNAWRTQGSKMFVRVDTRVPVAELIKGIIIQSGNDATVAMAEHIGGSEDVFAELMNKYAQMLGMHDSHFVNSTGLPDPNHVTSARDMGILARALIKNFPETYKIYSQKEFTYNNIRQTNRNQLLWRNNAVDGIKTGYTESAGYCLVASSLANNNMRLIAIVMGTKSDNARTEEANKLLSWGSRFYETHLVLKAGNSLQENKIWMGKKKRVPIGFAEDLYVTTTQGNYKKYTAAVNLPNFIKAPVKQGDVLGAYVIMDENKQVIHEQPLIALKTIPQGNILQRSRDYVALNVKSLYSKNK